MSNKLKRPRLGDRPPSQESQIGYVAQDGQPPRVRGATHWHAVLSPADKRSLEHPVRPGVRGTVRNGDPLRREVPGRRGALLGVRCGFCLQCLLCGSAGHLSVGAGQGGGSGGGKTRIYSNRGYRRKHKGHTLFPMDGTGKHLDSLRDYAGDQARSLDQYALLSKDGAPHCAPARSARSAPSEASPRTTPARRAWWRGEAGEAGAAGKGNSLNRAAGRPDAVVHRAARGASQGSAKARP